MKTKSLVFTAMMTAVTVVCSLIVIPLPFSPVPFTLSLLAVFLSGALLDKKHAVMVQVIYILLGVVGLPVFSGFRGGLGAVVGPTGGYLAAYPLMAFVTAWATEKIGRQKWYAFYPGMALGLGLCYALGTAWLAVSANMSFGAALMAGVVPFAVLDVIKIVIAASLAPAVDRALGKLGVRQNG